MKYIAWVFLALLVIGCSSDDSRETQEQDPPCYADGDCNQDGTPLYGQE